MKYSVIIPAYNAESYLKDILRFVDIVRDQRQDVEFIIIDDGSSDNTFEILRDKQDVIFFHQKNQGVSAARNKGIELSSGDFLLFLDADDKYEDNIFEVLDQYISEDKDVYAFNYKLSTTPKNVVKTEYDYIPRNFLIDFFKKDLSVCICSLCIRRSLIINHQTEFPVGFTFGEDIYFIIKIILSTNKSILYIPNVLFTYQLENSNTVASPINSNKIRVLDLYASIEIQNHAELNDYLQYFIQRTYLYLIKLSLKFGVVNDFTKEQLFSYKDILQPTIAFVPSMDFIFAKKCFNSFSLLIFKIIKVKKYNDRF